MTWARELGLAKPHIANKIFASEEEMRKVVSDHKLTLAGVLMVNGKPIKIENLSKTTILNWYAVLGIDPPAHIKPKKNYGGAFFEHGLRANALFVLAARIGAANRIYTLAEIANHFEKTTERVRQIEGKALRQLRIPNIALARELYKLHPEKFLLDSWGKLVNDSTLSTSNMKGSV